MVEVDWRAVGRRIAAERTLHGWTQDELAVSAKVSQQTIAQVELGRREGLRVQTLLDIAEALGVSYQYILEGRPA